MQLQAAIDYVTATGSDEYHPALKYAVPRGGYPMIK